jgi:hypothetical protein
MQSQVWWMRAIINHLHPLDLHPIVVFYALKSPTSTINFEIEVEVLKCINSTIIGRRFNGCEWLIARLHQIMIAHQSSSLDLGYVACLRSSG